MSDEVLDTPTLPTPALDGHRIAVVDTPAGHGRSELLRQHASSLGSAAVTVVAPVGPDDADRAMAEVDRALHDVRTVVIDDVHRGGPGMLEALSHRCAALPDGARLVVGGAGLGSLPLGDPLLDGTAVRLGPAQLPLRASGAVLDDVLRTAWRRDLTEAQRSILGPVIRAGTVDRDLIARVATALGEPTAVDGLARLPLVEVGPTHVDIDVRWTHVVDVDESRHRTVTSALANALVDSPRDETDLDEAGRLAIAAMDADTLRRVVRAALASHPPRVGAHTLRSWWECGLLAAQDPHTRWLAGVCHALRGAQLDRAVEHLRAAREGFAELDDHEGEIDAGLALGIAARRTGDLTTLAELVLRSRELEDDGAARAASTRLLGEALLHQMSGEPDAALGVLAQVPADAFDGDWAAQVLMMRGTNLLLMGRHHEAAAQLLAATGVGSAWSYATALSLLAAARWTSGDGDRAVQDLAVAQQHARRVGAVAVADLARATRAAMLAALGDPDASEEIADAATGDHLDDEGRRLLEVARALHAAQNGDAASARRAISPVRPPDRGVLSTFWTVALQTALGTDGSARWVEVVERHGSLRPALEAGRAAAAHLAGGPSAPAVFTPYLPLVWCEPGEELVELQLLGAATARRGRRVVDHRAWDRGRVRELCLHLALIDDSSRDLAAGRLWPDLAPDAAARNLRVTLTHLLDVVDPRRPRGSGSDLIDDRHGVVRFASSDRLRIDIRRSADAARAIVDAAAAGDDSKLLASARRLAREPSGQFLAGSTIGEWIEPYSRIWTDLLLRATSSAAPAALRAGDPDLAEELARRGLELDPWAERLHQLLVRARLARDDLDGARRAWREAIAQLDELGVRPERETVRLGAELGIH